MNSVEKFKTEYPRIFRFYKYNVYKSMLEEVLKCNKESLSSFDKPPKELRVTTECLDEIAKLANYTGKEWEKLVNIAEALDVCSTELNKEKQKAKIMDLHQIYDMYENNFGGPLGEIVEEAVDEFTWAYNFSVGGKHKDLNRIVREMKWFSNDINFLDEWQIAK